MNNYKSLVRDVKKIKERNRKVELEKAWETSLTRRISLMVFTYLSISMYMYVMKLPDPWINAIIPSIGFLLSTLSLPFIKNFWLSKQSK